MSVTLMSRVWTIALDGGEQRVLMCMADFANDDGTSCFPSIPLIAWKTGLTERGVQKIIAKLKAQGILEVVDHPYGGRGHPTEYHIHLEKGEPKTPFRKPGRKGEPQDTLSPIKGEPKTPFRKPGRKGEPQDTLSPIKGEPKTPFRKPGRKGEPQDTLSPIKGELCNTERVNSETERVNSETERVNSVTSESALSPDATRRDANGTISINHHINHQRENHQLTPLPRTREAAAASPPLVSSLSLSVVNDVKPDHPEADRQERITSDATHTQSDQQPAQPVGPGAPRVIIPDDRFAPVTVYWNPSARNPWIDDKPRPQRALFGGGTGRATGW